jgi:hypothetical protein
MIVLVSGATATVRRLSPHAHLGILLTPRAMQSLDWIQSSGIPWAADNDCFRGLDVDAFCRMVERISRRPQGCRFVAIPDVVADHEATREEWELYYPAVRELGLPCAFVLQDGATSATIPWQQCQAIFLGGSTAYKESEAARSLCEEARQRGKWVHVGRVNSARREDLISTFANSFDGSKYSMFARQHLPACLTRLAGDAGYVPPFEQTRARTRAVLKQDQLRLTV